MINLIKPDERSSRMTDILLIIIHKKTMTIWVFIYGKFADGGKHMKTTLNIAIKSLITFIALLTDVLLVVVAPMACNWKKFIRTF